MIYLVLGGARSGKSRFAQQMAEQWQISSNSAVTYVATATAIDGEMSERIKRHQADRSQDWLLAEVPLLLTEYIGEINAKPKQVLLVDCLTLWLNNQLYHHPEQDFQQLFSTFSEALATSHHDIILVANEVGLGVIPLGEVSRQFVDQAGWLNQTIAKVADEVTFVAAGLPITMKG